MPVLAHTSPILAPSWRHLVRLVAYLASPGGILRRLGAISGSPDAYLARLDAYLPRLGPSWNVLARLGRVLGRLGGVFGSSWARLGGVLGASWGSWGRLETSWARFGKLKNLVCSMFFRSMVD